MRVDELPDRLRPVFVMADIEHRPASDIAAALKLPIGTVASRLHRARKLMYRESVER